MDSIEESREMSGEDRYIESTLRVKSCQLSFPGLEFPWGSWGFLDFSGSFGFPSGSFPQRVQMIQMPSKEVLNDLFLPPKSHPHEILGPSGSAFPVVVSWSFLCFLVGFLDFFGFLRDLRCRFKTKFGVGWTNPI